MNHPPFKKLFIAGTFDHFHIGHQYFIWSARKLCETLVIVVACDEMVLKMKKRKPHFSEKERLKRVQKENVPQAIVRLGRRDGKFLQTLMEEKPEALYLGFDQSFSVNMDDLKKNEKLLFQNLEILRGKPYFPEYFKSSYFRH